MTNLGLQDFTYMGTFYDSTRNLVFVGMKFLQPPVFDEKQPIAYKFGHLSYTMAHEVRIKEHTHTYLHTSSIMYKAMKVAL